MKRILPVLYRKLLPHPFSRLNSGMFWCGLFLIAALQVTASEFELKPKDLNYGFVQNPHTLSAEQEIRQLNPGETVKRAAGTNDVHAYQITLAAGTSVTVTFGNSDADYQVSGLIPATTNYPVPGEQLPDGEHFFSGGLRTYGPKEAEYWEPLIIVADKSGRYVVRLNFVTAGDYSITCTKAHPSNERDQKYDTAQRIYLELTRSFSTNSADAQMMDRLEERLSIYRSLEDMNSVAISHLDIAIQLDLRGEFTEALSNLGEALAIFRAGNIVSGIRSSLGGIAEISSIAGDHQTAIDSLHERLSLSRSEQEKANDFLNLGIIYHLLADEHSARKLYEQSLLYRKSNLSPNTSELDGETVSLINIGNLFRGVIYNEIVFEALGTRTRTDRNKALSFYKQALEVARKKKRLFPNSRDRERYVLMQIGNTYKELGNYKVGLTYLNKSLEIYRAAKTMPFYILMSIGDLHIRNGEIQKGLEYYKQALELEDPIDKGVRNEYLITMAGDFHRVGETQKALDLLHASLNDILTRQRPGVLADTLFEIARIERDQGNFANARKRVEEAIDTVESLRARITSQNLRTTYFSTVKKYYDFHIDLLMQAHKSQPKKGLEHLALITSENSRSRSLLDLLAHARVDIRQGVDPMLLEREIETRNRLSERAYQQNRLLFGSHTQEDAEKIEAEIMKLTEEYYRIETEIKNRSPRYHSLTQPTITDSKNIQQLLDSGTILLEYSLGEEKSYLWVVTTGAITGYDLPNRDQIETQARKVYELLTARNKRFKDESDQQRNIRIRNADTTYLSEGLKLSEMILGPARRQIGNKRLLIVPDGTLNYIPFTALPSLTKAEAHRSNHPLGMEHEIVTLPSASTLALLRRDSSDRKPAPKLLAVFADPVFDKTDVRARRITNNEKIPEPAEMDEASMLTRDFNRAVVEVGLVSGETEKGLPRLPFSRREADSIYRLAPRNVNIKQTDFAANKTGIFGSHLDKYRILHFATHGLLNSQNPELSGLVMSLIDEKGNEIDGFVRLQDIYNLKLSSELVVLSACNTALGKDVRGEGLIGLTRGFMFAGSPRVVASLWKVDDAATAELMSIFYRKMLIENLRPAAALRLAQIEMMKRGNWKSPYYWAPFIIQGEWR